MPSLVTLLPFVFELSSKNHREGAKWPPPGRRLRELAFVNRCAKFKFDTILFDPQKGCFVFPIVPNDDVLPSNAFFFFKSCNTFTGNLMVPLDCWWDSAWETCHCFPKNKFGKFDLFWTDLVLNLAFFRFKLSQISVARASDFSQDLGILTLTLGSWDLIVKPWDMGRPCRSRFFCTKLPEITIIKGKNTKKHKC